MVFVCSIDCRYIDADKAEECQQVKIQNSTQSDHLSLDGIYNRTDSMCSCRYVFKHIEGLYVLFYDQTNWLIGTAGCQDDNEVDLFAKISSNEPYIKDVEGTWEEINKNGTDWEFNSDFKIICTQSGEYDI